MSYQCIPKWKSNGASYCYHNKWPNFCFSEAERKTTRKMASIDPRVYGKVIRRTVFCTPRSDSSFKQFNSIARKIAVKGWRAFPPLALKAQHSSFVFHILLIELALQNRLLRESTLLNQLRTKFKHYVKISSLLKIGASRNPNYPNILE